RDQALVLRRNRLVVLNLSDQYMDLICVLERGQRSEAPRQVFIGRCRYAQGAEPVVSRKVEIFEQRQPCGPVDVPDHPFAPSVRPSIVHGTYGETLLCRKELFVDERQILAERTA